jgi:hypothetical protein
MTRQLTVVEVMGGARLYVPADHEDVRRRVREARTAGRAHVQLDRAFRPVPIDNITTIRQPVLPQRNKRRPPQ